MTDEEVFSLLFPDRRPVIDGVEYRARFWPNGSIGDLTALDSGWMPHGTVRIWNYDGSFWRDETYVHWKLK